MALAKPVSPSQGDMQWRARVGCEEFWAAFPVKSPRPEVESEGLIPIRIDGPQLRLLVEGPASGPGASRTNFFTAQKPSHASNASNASNASGSRVSKRSKQPSERAGSEGGSSTRGQLQQERLLRQRAELEAQELRGKLNVVA
ncbi:unnamed protein product [Effrenium voratum]|nr:unnamed protein product [Effrenium voratum]